MHLAIHNKEVLLQRIAGHGDQIKSYGVKELGLFGCFAKNSPIRPDSDIDFLVDFEPGSKTFDNFIDFSFYLERLLGRKVELVTRQSLIKYIGPNILKLVEHVSL
jgi:predicted nucleotidyltransferase